MEAGGRRGKARAGRHTGRSVREGRLQKRLGQRAPTSFRMYLRVHLVWSGSLQPVKIHTSFVLGHSASTASSWTHEHAEVGTGRRRDRGRCHDADSATHSTGPCSMRGTRWSRSGGAQPSQRSRCRVRRGSDLTRRRRQTSEGRQQQRRHNRPAVHALRVDGVTGVHQVRLARLQAAVPQSCCVPKRRTARPTGKNIPRPQNCASFFVA